MHAQKQTGLLIDCIFVIGDARAVGGAHLAKYRAALLHDFRDAKAVANFNQFAARHDHFAATSQGRKGDKNSGSAVVDHNGGFRAGQSLDESREVNVALTACSGGEVVFQVGIMRGGLPQFFDCCGSEGSASKIGVQDHPGGVDDRAEGRC